MSNPVGSRQEGIIFAGIKNTMAVSGYWAPASVLVSVTVPMHNRFSLISNRDKTSKNKSFAGVF